MSKYICDHADECPNIYCHASKGYDSEKRDWHIIHKDGFKNISVFYGTTCTCKHKTVYFIPYFEYLIRKTLKENKDE